MSTNDDRGPIDILSGDGTVSGLSSIQALPHTDVVHPEVLLYIEGVQVPFTAISISTSYSGLPEANISIPYAAGMQEICKGYFPKVHVFYKDTSVEKWFSSEKNIAPEDVDQRHIRRLLFSGVIIGVQLSKTRDANSASFNLSFRCVHKYYVLREIIMKFAARGIEAVTTNDEGGVAGITSMNSPMAMLQVIGGITGTENAVSLSNAEGNVNSLPADLVDYQSRFKGITGVVLAIWNLIKRDSFMFKNNARMMTDIYIPLVDNGLRLYKRMAGHPIVEDALDAERIEATDSELRERKSAYGFTEKENIGGNTKILVPPSFRTFIADAAAADIAFMTIQVGLSSSQEMSDMWGFAQGILKSLKYDLEILTSPIQQANRDKEAVDVLVKPLMPFYYSPVCNVLLPNLYHSWSYSDLSYQVPTRVLGLGSINSTASSDRTFREMEYRAPHEARAAAAYMCPDAKAVLAATKLKIGEYPGIHEYGRGVKLKKIALDRWISFLLSKYKSDSDTGKAAFYTGGSSANNLYGRSERLLSRRQIFPNMSDLEDPKDESRVWKYWNKTQWPVPRYNLDPDSYPGYNMEYGKAGPLPKGDITFSRIKTLRETTNIPGHWNVIYYPYTDSFAVFPPHFDHIRQTWWMTEAMYASYKKNNKLIYNYKLNEEQQKENSNTAGTQTTSSGSNSGAPASTDTVSKAPPPSSGADTLSKLRDAWNRDYPGNEPLNPYELQNVNGIYPYEITLFAMMDYEYSLALAETRTGNVECPFNPYIIPGYPMDLIEADTNTPSIHGFCVSVTHMITSDSIGTSVTFTSAMTYDELRAYELPSILPWFREKLGMTEKLSLIDQTEEVKAIAGEYYRKTLGVGFADPTILEDEDTGAANSIYVDSTNGNLSLDYKDVFGTTEVDTWDVEQRILFTANPNMTYEGSLNLVRREIESMADIERFNGINFIDIQHRLSLSPQERLFVKGTYQEVSLKPGRSPFLEYKSEQEILDNEAAKFKDPTPAKVQTQKTENK